ncbi:metallophosphoesterase [Clostridium sp. CCUG 7971]|uniref:metallophosphoesterase family protein n=1 Tax=Clostridium sp. CCUG 7971 TaxID=2811414 RepID=UPI001ABABEB8|nr:metallophosphoesterase [Clostridium sp. CCUG 7971]MBO3444101.1 metallophosphoesterase family protein [Clostridium sp. CCUG 7971]
MGKICIISDIHSNIHSLRKFLKYIEEKYDIDYILNLGDFIQDGPNPCEVFDIVMNDKRFINIMGNKEYELINYNHDDCLFFDEEESHELWTIEKLGKSRINRIKKLPLSKSIELFGRKFFMIHSNCEHLDSFGGNSLTTIITENSIEKFSKKEQTLNINSHDYLLIADNHLECLETHENYKIIKPGAISSLNNNTIKFVVIDINKGEESIYFKNLKHDAYEVVEQCINDNVPDPYSNIYTNKIKKEICDVSISSKYDADIIPIDWSFFPLIVEKLIKESDVIQLSCLNNELEVISEIRSKLNVLEEEETETNSNHNQIFFKVKKDKNIVNLLTSDFSDKNKLKWFSIYFYKENDVDPYFICEHNGYEIRINNLNKIDIDFIKNMCNNETITIDFY